MRATPAAESPGKAAMRGRRATLRPWAPPPLAANARGLRSTRERPGGVRSLSWRRTAHGAQRYTPDDTECIHPPAAGHPCITWCVPLTLTAAAMSCHPAPARHAGVLWNRGRAGVQNADVARLLFPLHLCGTSMWCGKPHFNAHRSGSSGPVGSVKTVVSHRGDACSVREATHRRQGKYMYTNSTGDPPRSTQRTLAHRATSCAAPTTAANPTA